MPWTGCTTSLSCCLSVLFTERQFGSSHLQLQFCIDFETLGVHPEHFGTIHNYVFPDFSDAS
jgi:hypothetical protein